jgi:hypothetical protein
MTAASPRGLTGPQCPHEMASRLRAPSRARSACELKNEPIASASPARAPSPPPSIWVPTPPGVFGADPNAVSIGANATFGDLVAGRSAAASFEATGSTSRSRISTRHGDRARACADFDRGPRLFAPWGETSRGGVLDLVALSPVPRSAQRGVSVAIALTDKGRFAARVGDGFFAPLSASDEESLVRHVLPMAASIVVTTERGVRHANVRALLDLLAMIVKPMAPSRAPAPRPTTTATPRPASASSRPREGSRLPHRSSVASSDR